MSVVYVKESTAVTLDGGARVLARGEAWDSESDVVKAHPEIFEGEPEQVRGRRGVERATRSPGERRAPSAAEKKAATAAKRKATADAKKAAAAAAKAKAAEKSADVEPADTKHDED